MFDMRRVKQSDQGRTLLIDVSALATQLPSENFACTTFGEDPEVL